MSCAVRASAQPPRIQRLQPKLHPQNHLNSPPPRRFSCTPLTPEQRSSYFDLRGFSHPIATSAPAAQALFDQGLLLAYNFNHPEALKAFQAGLKIDPDAPMLHWGVTYSLR